MEQLESFLDIAATPMQKIVIIDIINIFNNVNFTGYLYALEAVLAKIENNEIELSSALDNIFTLVIDQCYDVAINFGITLEPNINVRDLYVIIDAIVSMEDIEDKLEIIQHLEIAIKSKFEITCNYKTNNSNILNLTLKPLKIVNFEGYWYLLAIDENNIESIKKYYLKNISNLKNLNTTFLIDDRIDRILNKVSSIWFDNTKEPFEVKIQISKYITKYIERKPISPSQIFEAINEDGSSIISIKITHEMEILPIVKYWLPHLKVLEPKWIDDMICEELKGYLNIN